jgi:ribosomal-protein-alanine N-acetyltransferase
MNAPKLETENLTLVPQTRAEVLAQIAAMPAREKAWLSAAWLALMEGSSPADPWIHGFRLVRRASGRAIGNGSFTGPPSADGVVEIAYGVDPEHQGKGYATEAAAALVSYARQSGLVRVVRAHTLPEANASARVLTKCGFQRIAEVKDPEDGLIWRWEKPIAQA